jgi:hypothetical protein
VAPALPGLRDSVWFDAGTSWIGTDRPAIKADGEGPRRKVSLKRFGLERSTVTNRRFREFVVATGYVTEAERFGWSFVFHLFLDPTLSAPAPKDIPWWRGVDGAMWSAPEGLARQSRIASITQWFMSHGMTPPRSLVGAAGVCRRKRNGSMRREQDGRTDATLGRRGAHRHDDLCNIWQGRFPDINTALDGYVGTAPAESFAPNPAASSI